MAMTAADRQKRYREKRKAEGGARLDCVLTAEGAALLERLCERWECSQAEAIERSLGMADRRSK